MKPLPDPRESIKIIKYCESTCVDVIHSHGYKGNILLGLLPRSLRKIPVVTTVHGYTREERFGKLYVYQAIDRICLNRLEAIVIVSESMRNQIPQQTLTNKLYVINNGLPNINPHDQSHDYQSKFDINNIKIGSLGRLSFEKNFSLLIQAMKIIIREHPNARLVIYGDGPLRTDLRRLIDQNGLSDSIHLPGYLKDTTSFFSELDIFVNCSLTEGMPISLLEAMRQGCRIVATDIIANRCLLETLPCETYLCSLDETALARSILAALADSPESVAAQRKCYEETFGMHFSSDLMAKKYSQIYNKIKIHH